MIGATLLLLWITMLETAIQQETFKCYGLDSSNPNVCNGNGICSSANSCICLSGYSDIQCKTYSCFGYSNKNPNSCSANGICIKPNTCQCGMGWIGSDCSIQNDTDIALSKSLVSELNSKKINVKNKGSVVLPNNLEKYLEKKGFFGNDSVMMKSSFQENSKFVSGILTFSFEKLDTSQISVIGLETPIRIVFENISMVETNSNYSCAYYNEQKQTWQFDGLQTQISSSSQTFTITCKTNHLTRFTVIDLNLNREITDNPTPTPVDSGSMSTTSGIIIAAVVTSTISLGIIFTVSISIIIFFIIIMNRKGRRHCCIKRPIFANK